MPTPSQVERFKEHVLQVHSWYKHLPMSGGDFVVYLRSDVDGRFPPKHPKLPSGQNRDGYLEAFGHLAFMWNVDGGLWQEDFFDESDRPPVEYVEAEKFSMFPYCHRDFCEAVNVRVSGSDLSSHPEADLLKRLVEAQQVYERLWNKVMTDVDREWACSYDGEGEAVGLSDVRQQFVAADSSLNRTLGHLRELEVRKVDSALSRLLALHVGP